MTIIYIFIGFKLVLSCLYFYIMKLYLQFLCVAECLKPNNDTPKLNADFHSDGLLDNNVGEVHSF